MTEPVVGHHRASDGYATHVLTWPAATGRPRGRVVVLHGVQSHGGWYHELGRTLAGAGYEAIFPDRRGSGANGVDRGHTPSARRLIRDVAEILAKARSAGPEPVVLAGISWGGKLAVLAAADFPKSLDGLALLCPGLHPRVGVSPAERRRIAWAYFFQRRKRFPIPLADPALFTDSDEGQRFIAADPLGLRDATAGLLAASAFIDGWVRRVPPRLALPILLMTAGLDRIVDNARTRAFVESTASTDRTFVEYPEAHHTLEFEPDPHQYASDLIAWLDARTDEAVKTPQPPR